MADTEDPNEQKLRKIIDELGLKDLGMGVGEIQVDPEFTARLDDVYQSLFVKSNISATFASEMKYGLGNALGHRIVDWLWDSLSPGLKAPGVKKQATELRLLLPVDQRESFAEIISEISADFHHATGVLLPSIAFEDASPPHAELYWRCLKLGQVLQPTSQDLVKKQLLRLLLLNAWRLLSTQQVQAKLQELWVNRPELQEAFKAENLRLIPLINVLRELLRKKHPITEFDYILEATLCALHKADWADLPQDMSKDLGPVLGRFEIPDFKIPTLLALQTTPPKNDARPKPPPSPPVETVLTDFLEIRVGSELVSLINPKNPDGFSRRVTDIRQSLTRELGFLIPGIRVRKIDDCEDEFVVLVKGEEQARGMLHMDRVLVLAPPSKRSQIAGIEGVEPTFGLPGVWVEQKDRRKAEKLGGQCFTPADIIAICFTTQVRLQAHKIFSHQSLRRILNKISLNNEALVELIDEQKGLFHRAKGVFVRLLEEKVSITDPVVILDALLDSTEQRLSPELLTDKVREKIGAAVCRNHVDKKGNLEGFVLSHDMESLCLDSLKFENQHAFLNFEARTHDKTVESFRTTFEELGEKSRPSILVTHPSLRRPLRNMLSADISNLVVLSQKEIAGHAKLVTLGEV